MHMRTLITGMFFLMLSACASGIREKAAVENQQIPAQAKSHCNALSYYETLAAMTTTELRQEQLMLHQQPGYPQNSCESLHLIMLLSFSEAGAGAENKKEQETLQLLQKILYGEQDLTQQDRQIALLLVDQIQWRNKIRSNQQTLEQQLQSLKTQLKKERKASLNFLERLTELQLKLNQLKNIDKNINAREQEISTPSIDKTPHDTK